MAKILIAWQIGAGYGRISQIAPVAAALRARGHQVVLAVPPYWVADPEAQRMQARLKTLAGLPVLACPDPVPSDAAPDHDLTTHADLLHAWGFSNAPSLQGGVQRWRRFFEAQEVDAVLAHHAPLAMLAAQAAGLPVGRFGDGFVVPPSLEPMPAYRAWTGLLEARVLSEAALREATVLGHVQATLAAAGCPVPKSLGQWLAQVPDYLCTWPFLDHFGQRADAYYYGVHAAPLQAAEPHWPAAHDGTERAAVGAVGAGEDGAPRRVLVYLSADHPATDALAMAIGSLGWSSLWHQAWSGGDAHSRCAHVPSRFNNIRVVHEPIDFGQALAQADLLVCHAPHLSCAQALAAGKPVLLLPTNPEQEMVAVQLIKLGSACMPQAFDAPALVAALRRLIEDPLPAQRARATAQAMAGFDAQRAVAELAEDYCNDMEIEA